MITKVQITDNSKLPLKYAKELDAFKNGKEYNFKGGVNVIIGKNGSGKTTWAKQWVLEDPEHRVKFNNDDVRNMLSKYWVPSRELLVHALKKTVY